MLLWPGICIVHQAFSETELLEAQGLVSPRPGRGAPRMPAAHHRPCRPVGWTKSILDFALSSPARRSSRDRAAHHPPDGKGGAPEDLHRRPGGDGACIWNMCPYMALNTLEKLYVALRGGVNETPSLRRPDALATRAGAPAARPARAADGMFLFDGRRLAYFVQNSNGQRSRPRGHARRVGLFGGSSGGARAGGGFAVNAWLPVAGAASSDPRRHRRRPGPRPRPASG